MDSDKIESTPQARTYPSFERPAKPLKLTEIAKRIDAHLERFARTPEIAKPIGKTHALYWHPGAVQAGRYVNVHYVSYQGSTSLLRADAEKYLAWLDAGNVGSHWNAFK